MATKPKPPKNQANLVTTLAACSSIFVCATIGVPLVRDLFSLHKPSYGRLEFNLNPAACKATFLDSQTSLDPCTVEASYGFDPITGEMIVFLSLEEVRVPDWKDVLVSRKSIPRPAEAQ